MCSFIFTYVYLIGALLFGIIGICGYHVMNKTEYSNSKYLARAYTISEIILFIIVILAFFIVWYLIKSYYIGQLCVLLKIMLDNK